MHRHRGCTPRHDPKDFSVRRVGARLGAPPGPLFQDAARLGLRRVYYDRPGCGGSTPLPGRDVASVADDVAAVADALGIDRFAVMGRSGVAALRAATQRGAQPKETHESSYGNDYDPEFTPADHGALAGPWSWLGSVVAPAVEAGPGGLIDDDLAYVAPWGFDPAAITAPVLLLHGPLTTESRRYLIDLNLGPDGRKGNA